MKTCYPILLFATALFATLAVASPPQQEADSSYAGSGECQSCHSEEHQDWRGSHHDLAMQEASASTILGNFDNSEFVYNGVTSRFYRRGEDFFIKTDGPDGNLTEYKVEYVFGVDPLQQYLLAFPDGRLQALSVSWDTRAKEAGGQRWFHLYPDESIDHTDPLHWTGIYQNWNSHCAECHSTRLEKNFDASTSSYATRWTEINVSCEACHGPGQNHVDLAKADKLSSHSRGGFQVDLSERGQWSFKPGASIAERQDEHGRSQLVESCGRCHARRGVLGEYHYGRDLLDTHRVSLIEDPLYYPDGQILDEVYVYGSFVQSKMYQAGVVCSDCHDSHSAKLHAPQSQVCSQCHLPSVFDTPDHHRHAADSSGAQCINCHMPQTTYMVVDPRRDHSMRIPRPDLSIMLDTPNACNQCHDDKDAQWSLDAMRKWGVNFSDSGSHYGRTLQLGRSGDGRAIPELQAIALDPGRTSILRASAMVELGGFANREAFETAVALLDSPDPMLRMSAVRALEFVPRQQLFGLLGKHITDPTAAVRMEVARVLASLPLNQVDKRSAEQLRVLFDEYLTVLQSNADMPGEQLQMGVFFTAREQWPAAERAYRNALELNPQFAPALFNLADLYRGLGRDEEARVLLLQAAELNPESGSAWHALGLLEIRAGNMEQSLEHLQRAADLESQGIRYRYVYAIALHDTGAVTASLQVLKKLHRKAPANPDILLALVSYSAGAGKTIDARRYAQKLLQLDPDNAEYQRLARGL